MKQETNNEMDLLLRRLGRRDDAAMPEDHLDADELSAYAENALPATARTRYTVHLAECSRCRSLVAQLSSSAGVVAATDSAAVREPSGFRKFLASLFTPMVLRYAAPALGLILVAAIGFLVLRSNQPGQYEARNNETAPQQQPVASPAASSDRNVDSASNTAPNPGRVDEERKQKNQAAQPAPPPNMAPAVTSVNAEVSKDKAVAQPKPEEQPASAANEPPPVKTAPAATPEQSPRAAETEAAKNEVKVQSVAGPQEKKELRAAQREDRKKDSDDLARARKPADAVSAPATGSARGIQSGGGDFSSTTRTVAGRRFRKQGGVWVDTAYDSSKDAVTLSRDSEQYRALVADEPAIKTIAEQLEGEIIVVWKGHTYRIR